MDKVQGKPPMRDFGEITLALCDVHIISAHLVGIEMTWLIGLRCQAEGLEDLAF